MDFLPEPRLRCSPRAVPGCGTSPEAGNVGAQAAISLLENPGRLLSVTQVGVTLTSLALGWAGEETIFNILYGWLAPVVTPATTKILHGFAFALSFLVMSYAHVVFGEVVPKNLRDREGGPACGDCRAGAAGLLSRLGAVRRRD